MEKETAQGVAGQLAPVQPAKSARAVFGGMNDPFALQRAVGNQGMRRLLESGRLQAKLRVSQPGDADELEADHVAAQVVSAQAAPRLQRKCACGGSCAQCQEEQQPIIHRRARTGLTLRSFPFSIQRQAASTDERSHRASAAAADTRRDQANHPGEHHRTVIVEDDAPSLGPGQMRKREFVALLQTTTCATADAVLESVRHSTKGCPYIKKWLAHYKDQDAAHLTRAMHKYAPETGRARSAHEAIALVNQRVERAALKWAKTGKVTDLPEGIQEEKAGGGGFLGAVMGFAHSGFGSALLGFIGGGKKEEHGKAGEASGAGGVQRKSRDEVAAGEHDAAAVKEQLGSGQSLDGGVQSRMSAAFGYDFSGVRVHADAKAGELSGHLNARAFTIGRDVAFAQGEYQPGTLIGDALIAHELAHVVQQGGGNPSGGAQTKHASLGDDSRLEQDADRSAVGAVVSAWTGANKGLANIGANALPRLTSGLRLSRCSSKAKLLENFATRFKDAAELIRNSPDAMKLVNEADAAGVEFGGYAEDGPHKDTWPYTSGNSVYIPKAHTDKVTAVSDFLFELNNALRRSTFAELDKSAAKGAAGGLTAKTYAYKSVEQEVEGMLRLGGIWFEMKKSAPKGEDWSKHDDDFYLTEYQDFQAKRKTKDDIVKDVLKRTYTTGVDAGKTTEQYYEEAYNRLSGGH